MKRTHDDGHLHLEGVEVGQLCAGAVPGGVHAHGVGGPAGHSEPVLEGLQNQKVSMLPIVHTRGSEKIRLSIHLQSLKRAPSAVGPRRDWILRQHVTGF